MENLNNIKINLLRNKPKYTANLGDGNHRIYTPGEVITEQKDFMRFVECLCPDKEFPCLMTFNGF